MLKSIILCFHSYNNTMSSTCLDIGFTEDTKNYIKWLSLPKIGHWILKFTIARQTKNFIKLAAQVKALDKDFVVTENITQKDIINIQELYHLINSFYCYIASFNNHNVFELKEAVCELSNNLYSIKNKIEKHFTILPLSDISLLNEAHSITKKTLDKEWNTPQQDEVWNKFFAGQ